MTIEFLCPNGHRIRCPDERAGAAARCPRCGVKFRVPTLEDIEAAASGTLPDDAESDVEERIEFLCPNGHRLFGPRHLQGRPGQCPECGMRFRIPNYEEPPAEEGGSTSQISLADDENLINSAALPESGSTLPANGSGSATTITHSEPAVADELASSSGQSGLQSLASGWHRVIDQLWTMRTGDQRLEISLDNGDVIRPDRVIRGRVPIEFAVFADEENETTLVVIATASIRQVRLVGLSELPAEWQH